MMDIELKDLLKSNTPNIIVDSKDILTKCKIEKIKHDKRMNKMACLLSSFVTIIGVFVLSLLLIRENMISQRIEKINYSIGNLNNIKNDRERIIEIMSIEKETKKKASNKKYKLNLDMLEYETKYTISCLKSSVDWSDCLSLDDEYLSINSIMEKYNKHEIYAIEWHRSSFDSYFLMFKNRIFIKEFLKYLDLPYSEVNEEKYFVLRSGQYTFSFPHSSTPELSFYFRFNENDREQLDIEVLDNGYVALKFGKLNENGVDIYFFHSLIPLDRDGFISFIDNYLEELLKKNNDGLKGLLD